MKYHGTVQLNDEIPFRVVDVKESDDQASNGKPIIQAYGARSMYVARRGDHQVSAMRHGATKVLYQLYRQFIVALDVLETRSHF